MDIITSNQTNINCSGYAGGIADSGGGGGGSGSFIDDELMDPLFDEDWLHENNLDILFDLFEEEIESKSAAANNGSSTLFGTSPVASYLFGTSPSLASALDLLCFDQQSSSSQQQQPQATANINFTVAATNANCLNTSKSATTTTTTAAAANNSNNKNQVKHRSDKTSFHTSSTTTTTTTTNTISIKSSKLGGQATHYHHHHYHQHASHHHQPHHQVHPSNTATNAMRIKRGLRKGRSEGVSLLARPSNNTTTNNNNSSNGIKVNGSKCNQHNVIHCITAGAVIREHAYAVRGH